MVAGNLLSNYLLPMPRRRTLIILIILVVAAMAVFQTQKNRATARDWRTASFESVGLAPDPATTREPVIQVYAARTWGWRGYFGVHSWIAVKPENADAFTVFEVIGWRLRWGDSPVVVRQREADARWFGSAPELLADLRGDGVDDVIKKVYAAAKTYPYANEYTVWPGPNSNTFIAHILRQVPELKVDLPPTAIGKDYLSDTILDKAPSGTGVQFSIFGLLGFVASLEEGLELNLLGLTFGVDPLDPALKLPLVGRIGPDRKTDRIYVKGTPDEAVAETPK